MSSRVFFSEKIDSAAIKALFEKTCACKNGDVQAGDRVAVKVHFGEKGNTRFVPPAAIQPVVEALKQRQADFFLTDSNTLYRGMRLNATDHVKIALEHGFGALDAPILIADGELGDEEEQVVINKPIFAKVKIGRQIARADAIVAISHFKGHALFSFGGAIKNIGMGSGSRAGKLAMHAKLKVSIGKACTACGRCVEQCAANAIEIRGDRASIDQTRCISCAKCFAICDRKAVKIPWGSTTGLEVQQRCAEYAFGVVKGKKRIFVTFINNITKDCDCATDTDIISEDVGIVASTDPVACDQAAYDLVVKKSGDVFKQATGAEGQPILDYAEQIGLGNKAYQLIQL